MSLRLPYITGRRMVVIEEVAPPEEEEEEEEEEEAEEDEEEEEDDEEQIYIDVPDSPRVLQDKSDEEKNYKKAERGEGDCSCSGSQEDGEWKPGDAEGSFCLICMEAWTNGGEHQVWYRLIPVICEQILGFL